MENKLLEVEANVKILEYKNSVGTPIWMYMRYIVLYDFLTPLTLNASVVQNSRSKGLNAFKYLSKALTSNVLYFFKKSPHKEVLFYTISRGIDTADGFFNQYTDYYVENWAENCLTVEHSPLDWKWHNKRFNKEVIYNGPNLALSALISKSCKSDYEQTCLLMEFVKKRIKNCLQISIDEESCNRIIISTMHEMQRMESHARWVLKIAKKFKVKAVIISGGAYSRYYPINKLLKDNGIKTADLQHGYITNTNIVYNYSQAIVDSIEIKTATPNCFLSYGNWWNSQTNMPFDDKISIGDPHRTVLKELFRKNRDSSNILLIGCARNTERYIQLAIFLSESLPNRTVLFRPHPSERYEAGQFLEKANSKVNLDLENNLYKSLEQADVIVSEISTVLFEAIGLVPRIIVWRTDYSKFILKECPFESFENDNELLKIIANRSSLSIDENCFWENNWKEKFSNVLNNLK